MLKTLDFPTMQEKTLRYPGHREKILMLRAAGFFDDEPIRVDNCHIAPRNMTARILFDRLKLQPGEKDMTVMRLVAEGEKNKRPLRIIYDLIDHYDPETGIHSMARTTGYTATMIARAFAQGLIRKKGIIPPEYLGFDPVCLQFILKGLEARKIKVREKIF
jgi:saccharopine dehydrogenase-like NADP-dependent oxidoreductase